MRDSVNQAWVKCPAVTAGLRKTLCVFTPEIEVLYLLFDRCQIKNRKRSLKQYKKYSFRSKIQLDSVERYECMSGKHLITRNDYSTYLCTVDGVAVPLQPFAIATVVCKWLLRNSYAIYCTQAGRVIIGLGNTMVANDVHINHFMLPFSSRGG